MARPSPLLAWGAGGAPVCTQDGEGPRWAPSPESPVGGTWPVHHAQGRPPAAAGRGWLPTALAGEPPGALGRIPVGLLPGHSTGCGCPPPRGRPGCRAGRARAGRLQRVSASGPLHGGSAPPSVLSAGGRPCRSGPAGPGQDFCVCGSSRVASHPMLMVGRLHWLRVASSTPPLTLADALVPRSHQPCRAQLRWEGDGLPLGAWLQDPMGRLPPGQSLLLGGRRTRGLLCDTPPGRARSTPASLPAD